MLGLFAQLCGFVLALTLTLPVRAEEQRKEAAAAQPDAATLARARTAFQQGVQASARRDYVTASARFREALELHYAPATAFNLASALYELEQHVEAYNLLQDMLTGQQAPSDDVRARAQKLAETLELEVARLNVVVSGATTGLSAEVDGQPLAVERFGKPHAVATGTHVVTALRDGQVVSRRELDIPVRTTALVDLSLIVTAAPPPPVSAPPPIVASTPERNDSWYVRNRKVFWISVAAGVVVAGAAVATALVVGGREAKTEEPLRGDTGVLSW